MFTHTKVTDGIVRILHRVQAYEDGEQAKRKRGGGRETNYE